MSILLTCADIFWDGAWVRPRYEIASVKLVALAEILDWIQHPSYDRKALVDLTKKLRMHTCVSFVGHLLNEYFGFNPLRFSASRIETIGWPYTVGQLWRNIWTQTTPWSSDDLLVQRSRIDMSLLIEHLGANSVTAEGPGRRRLYSSVVSGNEQEIRRVISRSRLRRELDLEFSVAWLDELIVFDVSNIESHKDPWLVVRMDVLESSLFWMCHRKAQKQWTDGEVGSIDTTLRNDRYGLHVVFPLNSVKGMNPQQDSLPVILTVYSHSELRDEPLATTSIPMRVVRKFRRQ